MPLFFGFVNYGTFSYTLNISIIQDIVFLSWYIPTRYLNNVMKWFYFISVFIRLRRHHFTFWNVVQIINCNDERNALFTFASSGYILCKQCD